MNQRFTLRFAVIVVAALCTAPSLLAQKTSTPEERKHWVEVSHQLEAQPTNDAIVREAEATVKRLIEVSDFHLVLCPAIAELPKGLSKKYPLTQLYLLGLAAYQIETGDTSTDKAAAYALQSALKGYKVILQENAKARDKKMDELAKMELDGKLLDLVHTKGCK